MKKTILTLTSMLFAGFLQAETISLDFGLNTYESTGNWNNFSGTTSFRFEDNTPFLMAENMINSLGVATTVDFYFMDFNSGASAGIGGINYTTDTSATTGLPLSATRDGLFVTDGAPTAANFEIRGLEANTDYNLTFFAGADASPVRADTNWISDGQTVSISPNLNTAAVTIFNAQSDGSGTLGIRLESTAGGSAGLWHSLEIATIPEPSSLILFSMALGSVLLLRRRIK
ncbi:PEP-CTERM sorting domain-containing protein [Kiritimatiellota bacterium B12222]|nr:PEP-CTERM sorting domain-containing protein [Kiritimatiellota bacterium B12222]